MANYRLSAVVWEEDGAFVAKCPELGVASEGDSVEHALQMLKEAVELYLENAEALGIVDDAAAALNSEAKFTTFFEVVRG